MDSKSDRNLHDGLRALQRNLEGATRHMQAACNGAAQNASRWATFVQCQRLHLISRTTPFAALNLQFARAAESSTKIKKKRKEHDKDSKASKGKDKAGASASPDKQANERSRENDSKQSQAEVDAHQQKAKEEELERRKEEKRQANERKRQEAEARRRAADQKKQEAKRRQDEAQELQVRERQKQTERESKRAKAEADSEERALQKVLNAEAKRILKRQFGESEFVRSLDEVELDDINDGKTLTGLRPVFTDELTEEHDEMMREALAEEGAEYSFNPEEKTLAQLLDAADKERKRQEMSADEPGIPIKSREQLYDEMRGEDLMPHAPKMQLRHEEEDGLELDRFGEGHFFHPKRLLGLVPWGVVHDLSWGLFGRIEVVRDRLGPKWGGRDPLPVMQDQQFYDDILNIAPEMEMTVMMVAERDIPLADLRNKLLDTQHLRLRQVMYEEDEVNPLAHKHKVLLAKIKLAAMEDAFMDSGLMDARGHIKKNSKLVLVVTEDGALTAEAVTPGSLIEQKVVRLGRWTDTTFARSVMDNFLGAFVTDNRGKNAVGNGVLWCANGFDFRAPGISDNPNQFWDSPPREDIPDYLSRPEPQEGFVITPEIFSVDSQHRLMIDDLSKNKKLHSAAVPAAT